VCATDVKIYHYGHRLLKLPRVLGHELAGVIDAVGPEWGARYRPGQRVAVCAVINCGLCRFCLRGMPSMCEQLEAFGYHYDGGYQEYLIIPAKSVRCGGVQVLPDNVSFEEAAVAELLACSLNGQALSDFRFGQSVLIIGAGPVGLLQARLARARGCGPVFITDIVADKLARAADRDGLATLDAADLPRAALEATAGYGFDQVMICCGAAAAQQAAIEIVAKGGCVNCFGGLPQGNSDVTLDTNHIHYKQARVVGTHGSSALENQEAVAMIARGQIRVDDLITDRIDLAELESALRSAGQNPQQLKTVVVYQDA
jgi:L-iditol 2-dehydrogenase